MSKGFAPLWHAVFDGRGQRPFGQACRDGSGKKVPRAMNELQGVRSCSWTFTESEQLRQLAPTISCLRRMWKYTNAPPMALDYL